MLKTNWTRTLLPSSLFFLSKVAIVVLISAASPILTFNGITPHDIAHAESQPAMGQARITVERESQGESSFVVVKINVPVATRASSFVVSSPPRIVIDLEGTRIRKNSALPVPNNPILKQIRIGAHPEKLRIVLDVNSDPPPQYDLREDGRVVTIRLLEKGNAQSLNRPSEIPATATTEPIKQLTDEKTPSPTATPTLPVEPTVVGTSTPVPAPSTTSPPRPTVASTITITSLPTNLPLEPTEAPTSTPAKESPTALPTPEKSPTKEPTPTKTPVPTKTAIPTKTATPTKTPTNTATAIPTKSPTTAPTVPPTQNPLPSATATPDPKVLGLQAAQGTGGLVGDVAIGNARIPMNGTVGNKLLVMGYRFDDLQPGRIPIIKISLVRPKIQVQMSKVDSKAYKIVIPGGGLATAQLALPQFPPADFVGFTMVSAQEFDNRAEITIMVEPGVTLGTFVRDNEIWVKRM
jgi:hypothetical protein